jgi:hypothetical protein
MGVLVEAVPFLRKRRKEKGGLRVSAAAFLLSHFFFLFWYLSSTQDPGGLFFLCDQLFQSGQLSVEKKAKQLIVSGLRNIADHRLWTMKTYSQSPPTVIESHLQRWRDNKVDWKRWKRVLGVSSIKLRGWEERKGRKYTK